LFNKRWGHAPAVSQKSAESASVQIVETTDGSADADLRGASGPGDFDDGAWNFPRRRARVSRQGRRPPTPPTSRVL
jgi:hypothetical protein